MRTLVGIPCLYGAAHTEEAIKSIVNHPYVDLLLIDNGAEQSVKDVLMKYAIEKDNVLIIHNPENVYVNPAWNQIMKTFLEKDEWDTCVIMNSDLIMNKKWKEVIDYQITKYKNRVCLPTITDDKKSEYFYVDVDMNGTVVPGGVPGVFIVLTKEQVKAVYPIPEDIKVWFGDNWIYDILRGMGFETTVMSNLLCYHYWSQNVSKVVGISKLIEEDKLQWEKSVSLQLPVHIERLKKFNHTE